VDVALRGPQFMPQFPGAKMMQELHCHKRADMKNYPSSVYENRLSIIGFFYFTSAN
jgi:hypothetical protein